MKNLYEAEPRGGKNQGVKLTREAGKKFWMIRYLDLLGGGESLTFEWTSMFLLIVGFFLA